jgi:hypothetical protein
MNKSKKTGIDDIDTPQMREMRQAVVEQELSARSWKAYYEKMYYSMEAEKLEQPYKEYQERMRKRVEDEKKRMEEFMKTLENNDISNEKGTLKIVESGGD